MSIQAVANGVKMFLIHNNASIMTGVGIAGVPVTAYLSGKAAVKASKELEKMKYESDKEPAFMDKAKKVAPIFVPPVMAAVTTMGCIYGANSVNARRIAALAGAYSMSESAFKDYKEKVVEIAGKKKSDDIHDATVIDKVQANPPKEDDILNTGFGDSLCYDSISGRYFRSNKEAIDKAFLKINNDILKDDYASWSDLMYNLGLPEMGAGEVLGWCEEIQQTYTSTLSDDFTPVLVVDYPMPIVDFAYSC